MDNITTALLLKWLMTLALAVLSLNLIDGIGLGWILLISILAVGWNYVIGDLWVLPQFGNLTAAGGDGVLAALVAYVTDLLVPAFAASALGLISFGVLIAVGEYFFHQYLFSIGKAPQ